MQTNKPTVRIKDCIILGGRMMGTPINYPEDHMLYKACLTNGDPVITSSIVSKFQLNGADYVETQRTIYEVESWQEGFTFKVDGE